jgi:hypothetical protein
MLPSYATAITYSCKSFLVQATGVFNGKNLKEICVFCWSMAVEILTVLVGFLKLRIFCDQNS